MNNALNVNTIYGILSTKHVKWPAIGTGMRRNCTDLFYSINAREEVHVKADKEIERKKGI